MAVWHYMPMAKFHMDRDFCDDCIKRGCSCNINYSTGLEDVDDQGRLYPCCEYDYYEDGIEEYDKDSYLLTDN